MRFGIVYHKGNIAGKNIVDRFKEMGFMPHVPVIEMGKETIYTEVSVEKYPELKEVEFLFFPCTHRSQKGDASLCLHVAGNWRGNELGGREGKVCMASAFVMKYLFQRLDANAKQDKRIYEKYKISMEATHHGPLTDIPSCFIELGSLEEEWKDEDAARVLAKTMMDLQDVEFSELNSKGWKPTVAVGGGHYCLNFNRIQLNGNYAIGHIIPDYGFPINEKIIKEAEEKTKEQVKEVLIDWKAMKAEERNKLVDVLDRVGLDYKKTSNVKK